jgi:DNA-binding transcriptional ArsR family regulator
MWLEHTSRTTNVPRRRPDNRAGVNQSAVSGHLERLAQLEFVHVDHIGTSSLSRLNRACLASFPSAAGAVIGKDL